MNLNQKYLNGVNIKGKASSNTWGLSRELLYSSVNIEAAATIAWTHCSGFVWFFELTKTLIDVLKVGWAAASHMIFWASVSAWLNIL